MVMGVGGHFLKEKASLGTMKMRGNEIRFFVNPRRVNQAGERVEPFGGPLAVLVDGVSLSAAEIFAGGMQDIGRARVFGETSPGQALPAVWDRLPNGDVLVVESIREWIGRPDRPETSANRITLFRDTNGDGKPDLREPFITGLNMPDGMALVGNWFYVGNTDGVVRYPYRAGQTKIGGKAEKILDLPAGGHHTRNLLADTYARCA